MATAKPKPRVFEAIDKARPRFWAKVRTSDKGDCWLWQGTFCTAGYGNFYFNGRMIGAHRFSVLQTGQELLPGRVIRHLCNNKMCVNPAHLQQGTYKENAHDYLLAKREQAWLEQQAAEPTDEEVAGFEADLEELLGVG